MTMGMRRWLAQLAVFAMFVSGVVVLPAAHADATEADDAGAELAAFVARLAEIETLPAMAELIPGVGGTLGEAIAFTTGLNQLATELTAGLPDEAALASAIDDADSDGFTFEAVTVSTSDGVISGSFDLAIARTASFPIAVQVEGDNIIGGNVDLTVAAAATTITFEYDTTLDVFSITSTPTIGIDVSADAAAVAAFPEVFGFTDISVSGSASIFAHVDITVVDPDADGRVTDDEIGATIVEDLFSVDLVDVSGEDAIAVGLVFSASIDAVGGPVSFGGTLAVADVSLADDVAATTTFSPTAPGLQPLDLLDNTDPNEIIGGLARLTGGLGAMMGVGDVKLPFLEDGIFFPSDLDGDYDKFFAAIQPLIDYVDPIAAGQIVCGSTTTEPEGGEAGIPIGSIDDVLPGESIFCRAYTAVDPEAGSSVTWTGVGTDPNPINGDALTTVGVSPSANVEFISAGGAFDASVTYEPEALGETVQINRRPETLQRLITELIGEGLISGVTYDTATSAVVFEFSFSEDLGARSAELDYGDRLLADTGLLGLEASASTLSIDIGTVSTGIGFGVFLVEDVTTINPNDNTYDPDGDGTDNFEPGTEDRFFVALDATQAELSVAGLSISNTDFTLAGRLGFLEVSAGVAAGSEPGTANTLAAFEIGKPNAADPVLAIDLALPTTPPGGIHPTTGITVGTAEYADAVLIRHLLADPGIYVSADANLSFQSRLEVSAAVEGTPAFATGVVGVRWDNITTGAPVVTTDGGFNTELLPFDLGRSGSHDGGSNEPFLTDSTVPAEDSFLGSGSLLGATLYNETDGSMCTIDVIPGPTTIGCALQGGAENDWDPGDSYLIRGDITGYLTQLLNSLEGLLDELTPLLESQAAWNEPLPVIGLSPNDLVSQIDELRMLLDEFRGIQAADISCVPVGGDDIRNVPVASGQITCRATSATDASAATWWIAAYPDTTKNEPTSVGPTPDGTVTLDIPADADTDGDGYVALGSEYTVVVEFSDVEGDHHVEFPPPDPQSLQDLRDAIAARLGIDPDALVFELDDLDGDSSQELIVRLGYGICSDPAPADPAVDCANAATVAAPAASINVDLGDAAAGLVGLELDGDIAVHFGASAQLDLALPLNGNTPLVLDTTGFAVAVDAGTEAPISLTANVGPISLEAGGTAKLDGTRTGGADGDTVADSAVTNFATLGLQNGHTVVNTTQDAECAATAVGAGEFGCDLTDDWEDGDAYRIGGVGQASVGALVTVGVDTGVLSYAPISALSFTAPEFTGLGANENCGTLPASLTNQVVGTGGDYALDGIGCVRLSLGLGVAGNIERYLGDLGLNFDPADSDLLQVYIPADLESQLAAAVLDLTLLFKALPELLDEVEGGLNAASDEISVPLIGDTLDAGADVVGVVNAGVVEPLLTNAAFVALLETFDNASLLDTIEVDLKDQVDTLVGDLLVDIDDSGAADADDITVKWDCGGPCGDLTTTQLLSVEGVEVIFQIGQSVNPQLPFDLGLDGLPFRAQGALAGEVAWSADIGIGLSRDLGPYMILDTAGDAELEVEANLTLGDTPAGLNCSGPLAFTVSSSDFTDSRCFRGKLGFLELTAIDGSDDETDGSDTNDKTKLGLSLGLDFSSSDPAVSLTDLLAGDLTVAFTPVGTANVDLHFRTGFAGDPKADFPSVLGTFHAGWDQTNGFDVAFADLHLDIGAFFAKLVEPTAKEIKRITSPLQPVVDTVTAPIPVLSELSELTGGGPITMLTLLEASTGADLSLIRTLAAFITFINSLDSLAEVGQIALGNRPDPDAKEGLPGGFQINTAQANGTVLPQDATKLINTSTGYQGGENLAQGIGGANPGTTPGDDRPQTFGVPGLSFPFLGDASQVFGVLVGGDATLIRWDAGTLKATAGIGYDFGPIFVGPIPVTVSLGGSITLKGRFAIGYDTSGIRKVIDGGSGVYLFDGIFIDDLNAAGEDVPEIALIGRVTAGAAIDLVIVSAGARGGIELTVELDLDDRPDPDGKLRIEEIITKLQNPICLFIVSGYLEAFLEVFVEIDLFLVSKEFAFELARIRLLDFEGACAPPAPVLAHMNGNTLVLHMGALAGDRNIAVDVEAEDFTVRQIGPGIVTVSAFGIQQQYGSSTTPVTLVQADAGTDDDTVTLAAGNDGDPPTQDTLVPFVIDSVINGGAGSDQLTGGDGVDTITGGGGNDAISGGKGDDIIDAGAGNDAVDGSFGTDHIYGGSGIDRISGGPGGDVLLGGPDDDSIDGGPGGPSGAEADLADKIAGNGGSDVVNGGFGEDVIFGDDPTVGFTGPVDYDWDKPDPWHDACGATSGDGDTLNGQSGSDYIYGGGGDDGIIGGDDGDFICGDGGDDEIIGDGDDAEFPGDDDLRGGDDDDELYGGDGHDLVMGEAGDDALYGEADSDDLIGGTERDLLFGGEGNDIMIGDDGTLGAHLAAHAYAPFDADTALTATQIAAVRDPVTLGSDTSAGTREACDEPAQGSGHADCLFGGNGTDFLFGVSSGDRMFGDEGADYLEGNAGDDTMRGGTQADVMLGNADNDTMFGDSGDDFMYGDRPDADPDAPSASGGNDTMRGGIGSDHMEGDGGADTMNGDGQADHMEGNGGSDTMNGDADDDIVIGGSDTTGTDDSGDALLAGGPGSDVVTGDNAVVEFDATGDVAGRSVALIDASIGGDDHIEGDAATDYLFGQRGNDTMYGDDGPNGLPTGDAASDYMEGNDGDDRMFGEAGNDDMIGGGSADDGIIDADRQGNGLADGGESEMRGGPGEDWMTGDNARIDRVLDLDAAVPDLVRLYDVRLAGAGAVPGGGDTMYGDADTDRMFGQSGDDDMHGGDAADYMEGNDGDDAMDGNDGDDDMIGGGSADDGVIDADRQGNGLADGGESLMSGSTGVDWMTGDNALIDRNVPSDAAGPIVLFDVETTATGTFAGVGGGDTMHGNGDNDEMFGQKGADTMLGGSGDDYVEGNNGDDTIRGEDDDDLLIGGGSADDGIIVDARVGDTLLDVGETLVSGGNGVDWMTGDNARILRSGDVTGISLGPVRDLVLFDVQTVGGPAVSDSVSGGDVMEGNNGPDVIFGQGNGSQSSGQADPPDGIDNDLDGREGTGSTEYDCADGFDIDGDGLVDGDDPHCQDDIDEDAAWEGDIINGGGGDDYIEGNHGADWLFGDDDEDDIIGGGSANDGVIDTDRLGTGLRDGHDVIHGDADDDVATGDNAIIARVADGAAWTRLDSAGIGAGEFGPYNQAVRVTNMAASPEDSGAFGNDWIDGDGGHDELYGQLGDDFVLGDDGDDALVGDLGQVRANLMGDGVDDPTLDVAIDSQSPHWDAVINQTGALQWKAELYAFDSGDGGEGGNDILVGYDGRDTAFGGPGDDLIAGDGDGGAEFPDPDEPEFSHITDPIAGRDIDFLFGGDDDDVLWGGRDDDVVWGGYGNDYLDVRPREAGDNGRNGNKFVAYPRDPATWFTFASPESYHDVDFLYGGWDHDAFQADRAANGPDPGDRLADWAGGYNVFYVCPSGYGDYTIARSGSPHMRAFLQELSESNGAYETVTNGTSGFRDLGYVFPNQRGQNSNPPHPDHVGHFTCSP